MNTNSNSVGGHVQSFLSFVFVSLNLLLWLPLLILAAIVRILVPVKRVQKAMFTVVDWVYRIAVAIDTWWLHHILKISFDIEDEEQVLATISPTDSPLIICNHQSWFDIFILQAIISRRGPILKFLIKRELLWVPVLGWVCLVLDFPRLNRKGDTSSRFHDLKVAQQASIKLGDEPGALLLFPEGTRYSPVKHQIKPTAYTHLLNPKLGGFDVMLQSIGKRTMLIDVSIRYETGDANCWRGMSGAVNSIHIKVTSTSTTQISDGAKWLKECWSEKDKWLSG
jgi:1-acyl-sn-glycerol-3-phosphate acyltransferase